MRWTEKDIANTGLTTKGMDSPRSKVISYQIVKGGLDPRPSPGPLCHVSEYPELMPQPKAKRSKYGNKKVIIQGIPFDSIKEGNRYLELKAEMEAGIITELELQPEYEFVINGVLVCTYIADFAYIMNGERVVEDVKSKPTRKARVYRIKNKLMRACFNIIIKES